MIESIVFLLFRDHDSTKGELKDSSEKVESLTQQKRNLERELNEHKETLERAKKTEENLSTKVTNLTAELETLTQVPTYCIIISLNYFRA